MDYSHRPAFQDAASYVEDVSDCLCHGREPWGPETTDELAAVIEKWPEFAARWLPSPKNCELAGLPRWFGRAKPFGELLKEQLLLTFAEDSEFQNALRALLKEGKS